MYFGAELAKVGLCEYLIYILLYFKNEMSDLDKERRQRDRDSLAEFRRLQHHQRTRYPEPGDLSLSNTASLSLNSHAASAEVVKCDTGNTGIFTRGIVPYSDPLYARTGVRSPEALSATVNIPVRKEAKPTDGLYHSVGATYIPEGKLSPVPYPKILGVQDLTRPVSPTESVKQGAEAASEISGGVSSKGTEPNSLPSDLFQMIPTTSSQLGKEEEEAESSEVTTSSLSETPPLSQSPPILRVVEVEPLAERAEISGDLGGTIPLGIPHPLASSTPGVHYKPILAESADAETTIDQAFAGIQVPDEDLEKPDLLERLEEQRTDLQRAQAENAILRAQVRGYELISSKYHDDTRKYISDKEVWAETERQYTEEIRQLTIQVKEKEHQL